MLSHWADSKVPIRRRKKETDQITVEVDQTIDGVDQITAGVDQATEGLDQITAGADQTTVGVVGDRIANSQTACVM